MLCIHNVSSCFLFHGRNWLEGAARTPATRRFTSYSVIVAVIRTSSASGDSGTVIARHRRPGVVIFWLLRCHHYSSTAQFYKTQHHAFSEPSTSTWPFISPHRPPTPRRHTFPTRALRTQTWWPVISYVAYPCASVLCSSHLPKCSFVG